MKKVRYVLFLVSVLVMIMNLYSGILRSADIFYFLLYVLTPLLYASLFILIKNDIVIPITFLMVGVLSLLDVNIETGISGGIFFICLALTLINKIWVNITCYLLTIIIVVGIYMFNAEFISRAINILLVYGLIYFLEYELSIKRIKDGTGRECNNCKGR